jgi:uncharacterized membrane protein
LLGAVVEALVAQVYPEQARTAAVLAGLAHRSTALLGQLTWAEVVVEAMEAPQPIPVALAAQALSSFATSLVLHALQPLLQQAARLQTSPLAGQITRFTHSPPVGLLIFSVEAARLSILSLLAVLVEEEQALTLQVVVVLEGIAHLF